MSDLKEMRRGVDNGIGYRSDQHRLAGRVVECERARGAPGYAIISADLELPGRIDLYTHLSGWRGIEGERI